MFLYVSTKCVVLFSCIIFSSCFLCLDLWAYNFHLILKIFRHYFSTYFWLLSLFSFGISKNMYIRLMKLTNSSLMNDSVHFLNFSILFMFHFLLVAISMTLSSLIFYSEISKWLFIPYSILFISQLAVISRRLIFLYYWTF